MWTLVSSKDMRGHWIVRINLLTRRVLKFVRSQLLWPLLALKIKTTKLRSRCSKTRLLITRFGLPS
ncbi:hypothetical protein PBCV1_a240L [Paramecium bursaria Chlorella virus 1]|uniref:Uncharacterized protein n=1 Tax=Paramecium bursaria Chlorella virus 1 TaxID=10506 RepID=Q84560_PBCV1|nr:hypothetical protein PBCV1_a240L [Paramecium bursaria Chlorella virus 1]AAC96608.1 hypothetical protein [Paramecium bursaria Chlorella virus 1]